MQIQDKKAGNASFSRSLIAGLICGIIAALLNSVYDLWYRTTTGFEKDDLISPVPIFIALPAILILLGIVFFGIVEFVKKGKLIFTVVFFMATLLAIVFDLFRHGTLSALTGMRGLLLGLEIVTGLIISFLLPFLATHPRIFMDNEELSESRFIN